MSFSINISKSVEIQKVSVLGKWKLTAQFYNGQSEKLTDCEKTLTIEFFDDRKGEIVYELIEPCHYETKAFEYSMEENKLTLSLADGIDYFFGTKASDVPFTVYATINKLDRKTLDLTFTGDKTGSFPTNEQRSLKYSKK